MRHSSFFRLVALVIAASSCAPGSTASSSQQADPPGSSVPAAGASIPMTDLGDDVWTTRGGFPADPADPEPIISTGANQWDIITTRDPSAFVCVEYLGQGREEILTPDKSEYEIVPNTFLFTARFSDTTEIEIRVHPEIGGLDAARAEVDRYTVPLGRLPTVLRRGIERLAIRLGDETATASPAEGISMQTGNTRVRLDADRLEETLFHEAVHTTLDATFAYMRSPRWMAAQEADGRWLTEYGRNNPDSEDLAETALFAYGLVRNPERFPAGVAATIRERIPNRIDFIETIIPPDRPVLDITDATPTCG